MSVQKIFSTNFSEGKHNIRLVVKNPEGYWNQDVLQLIVTSPVTEIFSQNENNNLEFALANNYPNPFNPSTIIKYTIPKQNFVELKIYDILGREVATLVNEEKSAGNYEINFNGSKLSSGVYFYRLQAGSFVSTKKFVMLK